MQTLTSISSHSTSCPLWDLIRSVSLATLLSNKSTLQAAETNASAHPCLKQTSVLESLSIAHSSSIFLSICGRVYWGKEDCVTVQAEQLGGGGKNPLIQQQVTLPTIWIFTLQLQFAIAGQMCQTCCLGFPQHRQEGGISSSHPCKRALAMFTNSLIEAKQNGGVAQLQTTKDRWPSILLLRPLNAPHNIPDMR